MKLPAIASSILLQCSCKYLDYILCLWLSILLCQLFIMRVTLGLVVFVNICINCFVFVRLLYCLTHSCLTNCENFSEFNNFNIIIRFNDRIFNLQSS